jgi:glycine/D-amino acid oxidase-like deaminating enzyme
MLKSDEGRTVAFWEATEPLVDGADAAPDSVDVLVVGGGIAGMTTAYFLAREGRQVAVVDDGLIGGGETCRTTAHLSNAIDDRIYRIEEWHGEQHACLAVEAHTAAIEKIGAIAAAESIDCDYARVDGFLIEAEDGEDDLEKEFDAARRCGLGVEWADSSELLTKHGGRCLRFPGQGQFHVLKYLRGLSEAIYKNGGKLISHTRVTDWSGGDRPEITTADGAKI